MIFDQRTVYMRQIQSAASMLTLPLQYSVDWPIQFLDWLSSSFSTQQSVLEENARLRAQQLLLNTKLQRVASLENENAQLRALLQSSPHVGGKFTLAQLLAANMDPFVQKVVLDKGSRDNVYAGQPVLDAYGVVGQVVNVGPFSSQVLLISDVQSAVPIQDSRNGVRAIAAGTGVNQLQLINVPDTADIQEGDLLVTSGLDQHYPQGYPVGVVKKVKRDPELRFASITVEPSARLDRGRFVLLVWPTPAIPLPQTPTSTVSPPSKGAAPVTESNVIPPTTNVMPDNPPAEPIQKPLLQKPSSGARQE